jgi:hypothetical protein
MKFMRLHLALLLSIFIILESFATNFDDVLLIINYTYPHYDSIPVLKEIYKKYFKNIVFYGSKQHPNVLVYDQQPGYLNYMCVADAMQRYPQYEGYLFLQDDCILSTWLLGDIDLSKIWFPHCQFGGPNYRGTAIDLSSSETHPWGWWQTQWGKEATIKSLRQMAQSYKDTLIQNWGHNVAIFGYSDMAYIPNVYKEKFIELAHIFGKNRVFLEIGFPTMVYCLESKNNIIWLPVNLIYADQRKLFNPHILFNHPLKLSSKQHQAFILDIFKQFN